MNATLPLRRPRLLVLAATFAAAGLALLAGGALTPARAEAPDAARVGTIDLFRVLQDAKPFAAKDAELRAWIEQEKAAIEAGKADLARLETQLDALDAKSAEARELRNELERKKLAFAQEFETRDGERLRRIGESRRQAFARAQEAVAQVAKARGLVLVLQVHEGELSGRTQAELSSEIYLRDVLYRDASLDITAAVLTLLDG